ncbi:hypothetical protein HRS9139_04762 [Pyrenophora teres f. teres]|nr:hypothetical protein HRS9139_04762 [Pyrenophora teres f. teres]
MRGRTIFFVASLVLPIMATPLPIDNINQRASTAVEHRTSLSVTQLYRDLFKREPIIEALPEQTSYDAADKIKRDPSEESEDSDADLDVTKEGAEKRRMKNAGGGPGRRSMKNPGGGPHKRETESSDAVLDERRVKNAGGGPGKRRVKNAGGGPGRRSMKTPGGGPHKRETESSDAVLDERRVKNAGGGPGKRRVKNAGGGPGR